MTDAKDEFEVDGAIAVFSTRRVEAKNPLDVGRIQIVDGIGARAGRMALNAQITDERVAELLRELPGGKYLLLVEDKFDPVRDERRKGQGIFEITQETKPSTLTGIDSPYYQNAYPVTAVIYGLYPLRDQTQQTWPHSEMAISTALLRPWLSSLTAP